jgi:hypothetical protein
MTRIRNRQRGCFGDGVSAIMSVFSEAPRNEKGPNTEEHQQAHYKYDRDAEQMFGVLHSRENRNFRPSLELKLSLSSFKELVWWGCSASVLTLKSWVKSRRRASLRARELSSRS